MLFHGSHDDEITLQIVERLYCKLNEGEATPIALSILMENKSVLELLDKCVNYQLPVYNKIRVHALHTCIHVCHISAGRTCKIWPL